MKGCNKCKQGKDESEFYKDKSKKDGLTSNCKECCSKKSKEYNENNREEINQKARKYRWNNREEINQKARKYRWNNREEINQKVINSPLEYNSTSQRRQEIELYEEIRKSVNDNVEVRCAYDGGGFEPTKKQIQNRLDAVNGIFTEGSESKLYCSDNCKQSCPIYYKHGYEEGHHISTSREVQPELRKMVFARDNYTCQDCHTHKDDLEVGIHCHHNEGVQWNPIESADVDKCKTLCKNCHNNFHSQPGYTYKDYQCPPHLKYNI